MSAAAVQLRFIFNDDILEDVQAHLSAEEFGVFANLCRLAFNQGRGGVIQMPDFYLARKCNLGNVRPLRRILNRLMSLGFVERLAENVLRVGLAVREYQQRYWHRTGHVPPDPSLLIPRPNNPEFSAKLCPESRGNPQNRVAVQVSSDEAITPTSVPDAAPAEPPSDTEPDVKNQQGVLKFEQEKPTTNNQQGSEPPAPMEPVDMNSGVLQAPQGEQPATETADGPQADVATDPDLPRAPGAAPRETLGMAEGAGAGGEAPNHRAAHQPQAQRFAPAAEAGQPDAAARIADVAVPYVPPRSQREARARRAKVLSKPFDAETMRRVMQEARTVAAPVGPSPSGARIGRWG